MVGISILITGATRLTKTLASSNTVGKPIDKGIHKIALYYEGLVKRHTVVATGRLRSSVTSVINPPMATIGTNVQYAQFVEYGTSKMEARHMEGSSKMFGKGAFTYALELLHTWLGRDSHNIHKEIDKEFKP